MESFEETFELFKQGRSLPEIAFKRKLAFSTIENHLRILIEKKRIRIEELVSPERIELIQKAIPEKPESLSEIKNSLPRDVSYGEIKWILTAAGKFKAKNRSTPILKAINTYVGNNCTRKCFNHPGIFGACREKFELLTKTAGQEPISVGDFFQLMNSGGIQICKLPVNERKKIVFWRQFEQLQDNGTDFWDLH
ncbi:MAG: helix-turn-helix domain-containing protein [Candidatus Micrarchaeota archaeon]